MDMSAALSLSPMPSQARVTSMSIDSRFADQYFNRTSDFMIRLPSTMRNVMRISLSSVELPQVAYVFSKAAGNTAINVCIGATQVRVEIAEGNYTPGELASAVQAAIRSANAGLAAATVTYNSITDRFTFGGATFSALLYDVSQTAINERSRYWGIGFHLGFRKATTPLPQQPTPVAVSSAAPAVSPSPSTTAAPSYMLLQLQCPDMMENTVHRTATGTYVHALAKLVLRSGAYHIQTDDGSNLLRKENIFPQPISISHFRIRLVDAFGDLVEMGDADWSMTFEIAEVVNSCQYTELNRTYGRC